MRLLKLEILNLASLDRQEGEVINFEEGALKESHIFSIVGSTGSGKSTLLDAICLALYDRAPRYVLKKRGHNRIAIYGEPEAAENNRLAPTDCRNILTRGKNYGYSKLTFMANDGSVYRAEWSVRFKTKDYDKQRTSLYRITMTDGKPREEEMAWSTLPQIIGLAYDQFLRTVLIAQGSFADFLAEEEDKRYELLEKLVGNGEQYTQIALQIRQQRDQAVDAYKDLDARLATFRDDIVPDPELKVLTERVAELEQEEKDAQRELGEVTRALAWYEADEVYARNIARYEAAFAEARQQLESIRTSEERLKLHDLTLEAVALYRDALTAQAHIHTHGQELERLSALAEAKGQELAGLQARLAMLTEAEQQANQTLDEQRPHINQARIIMGELVVARQSVKEKTAALAKSDQELADANRAVSVNTAAIKAHETDLAATIKASDTLRAKVESAIEELVLAHKTADEALVTEQAKADGLDPAALQAAKSKAEQQQHALTEAIRLRRGIEDGEERLRQIEAESNALAARNNMIDEALARLTIEALRSELTTLRETYTLMSSEDWQRHRAHLTEGEACPLCGSIHHPYASHEVIAPVTDELLLLIRRKDQTLQEQTAQQTALTQEKGQNEGRGQQLTIGKRTLEADVATLRQQWEALHAVYAEWPTLAAALEQMTPSLTAESQRASAALDQHNALMSRINTLRSQKEASSAALNRYKEESAAQLRAADDRLNQAAIDLKAEQAKAEPLRQQQADRQASQQRAADALQQALDTVRQKEAAIRAEIGQRDADTYEQQLLAARHQATAAVTQQQETISQWREAIEGIKGKQEAERRAQQGEEQLLAESHRLLSEWLSRYNQGAEHPLDREAIAELYAATTDWEAIRRLLARLTTAFTTAQTTYCNERQARLEHQQLKPDREHGALVERKAQLERRSNAELMEKKMRVSRHVEAQEKMGRMGQSLREASQLKADWEEICSAMGKDGNTLRKIAQCYTLRFLVEHANDEIRKFNKRYELKQVTNSLGIRVIDHDRADDVRDTTSLSGGETFIVSLGLALGLSALSSRHISFDNLFIDEGFGTLDPDTLTTVIDSLAQLQTQQGKKVGVISHTDAMSERITTQIRVIKHGDSGSSHIEVYPTGI